MIQKRQHEVAPTTTRTINLLPLAQKANHSECNGQDLTSLIRDVLQSLAQQANPDLRQNDHIQRLVSKRPASFGQNKDVQSNTDFICERKRKIQSNLQETENKRQRLTETTKDTDCERTSNLLLQSGAGSVFTANANENNDNSTVVSSVGDCDLITKNEEDSITTGLEEEDPNSTEIFTKRSGRRLSYNTNPLSSLQEISKLPAFPDTETPTSNCVQNLDSNKKPHLFEDFNTFSTTITKIAPVSRVSRVHCSTVNPSSWTKSTLKPTRSDPGLYRRAQRGIDSQRSFLPRTTKVENLSPLQGYNFGDFTDNSDYLALNRNTNATTSERPLYLRRRLKHTGLDELVCEPRSCDLLVAKHTDTGLLKLQVARHKSTSSSKPTSSTTCAAKNKSLQSARKQTTRICDCSSPLFHTKTCDALYTSQQVPRTVTLPLRQRRGAQKETASGRLNHQQKEAQTESSTFDQDIAASVRCLCRIEERCPACQSKREQQNRSPSQTEESTALIAPSGPRTVERRHLNVFKRSNSCGRTQDQLQGHLGFSKDLSKQRSFSNNHKCFDEQDLSKNPRRKPHHCCDPFCLLFGGTSSLPSSNPSIVFSKLLYAAQAASPKNRNLGIITPDQTDMGCFHSVSNKSKVGPCRTNIHSDVQATIDQSPTVIEEYSPIVLRYRTPYFRANAQVIMPPIRRKETWTVGWIQACDYMKFINQYGNLGCSSWEIPALKSGRIPAVSDSDGVSYPWYGNTTEIATIVGPTDSYRSMNLTMNDNFYPSVTWDIPVSEGTSAHLTRIVRDQSFVTWLAAINETTKEIIVLKTVRWKFYLEIDIDPTRELGSRSRIVAPRIQKQPLITNGPCEKSFFNSPVKNRRRGMDNNSNSNYIGQIPISALVRPSANNAQTLIWRPTETTPIIVVPAKEEHKDTNELILFNGCSAMHGKETRVKEISKQEMLQFQQAAR
uniref:Uncharacterized protein LOC494362 n=1 Tax=Phallusia mammillata TaxID=59560 RepID=A0A6F9DK54_9ASCI|nr:uncharacterized protein LOC494362 [Phallusia mammillata]